jgi:membrane associated rhomboid family serine protease
MGTSSVIGIALIIINLLVTYLGLKDPSFFDRYSFEIDPILISKDYKRLITSGFLHVSWTHVLLNMLTLYWFSDSIAATLGNFHFLVIYFASLIGGNLLSLYIHRNHGDYSAVGASGAISGVVFASIALFPGMSVGLFGLLFIPGWAYGLFFVLFSIYGIRSQRDNIGHDAHLGGGIIGMLIAVLMVPESLRLNYLPILVVLVPSAVFLYLIITRPAFLMVDNLFQKTHGYQTKEDRYNGDIRDREKEVDRILEKINRVGIDKLTKKEREKLDGRA